MTERSQRHAFNTLIECLHRGVTRQIQAHQQQVHKESDQLLNFTTTATGDGGTDDHIFTIGVAPQQQLPGTKEEHKRSDIQVAASLVDLGRQCFRQ